MAGLSHRNGPELFSIVRLLTDELYEKLLILEAGDDKGNVVERERRSTVTHATNSFCRAWRGMSFPAVIQIAAGQ
ncbi:MAG: hypothetical protein WAV18_30375 [Roseiarcus sp.]